VKTVMFTNYGGIELALNAIGSLCSVGISDIALACDSEETIQVVSSHFRSQVNYSLWDELGPKTNLHEHFSYGTSGFIDLMKTKISVCLSFLRSGDSIFYIDTDVFVLRNYLSYLAAIPQSVSICFQPDRIDVAPYQDLCAGVFFARPTRFSLSLLQKTYDCLDFSLKSIKPFKLSKLLPAGDQSVLNALVGSSGNSCFTQIGTFPAHLFVNGQGIEFLNQKVARPFLFHNNYIVGSEKKIDRFKMLNMWSMPKALS